jgi:cellulose synthase/poly-beta-1,6-N-acetylglucosamine synthase-like glycosyltransferase
MSTIVAVGQAFSYVALFIGIFFFIFACKYYFAILIALFSGRTNGKNGNNGNNGKNGKNGKNGNRVNSILGNGLPGPFGRQIREDNGNPFNGALENGLTREPFVSIQLPFYNEKNVARRIIQACVDIDYSNYEIMVADDSRDETIDILKELNKRTDGPTIKFIHRKDRSGFKGGALQKAIQYMDPRTEYAVVFDADFIPPPDILKKFLWYFEGNGRNGNHENGEGHRFAGEILDHYVNREDDEPDVDIFERVDEWYERRRIGVVQGYQLHHLNKNENWITKGVRCEFSGGYMIERVSEEFFGSMKMITGSVFMIRSEILKKLGWTHSITEDWDLTLRMYMDGYKVLYTPLIQAPAEIPTTVRAIARQRMRWAEGHTFAVKKYFWDVLRSPNLTGREKMEFLYFAPYYLQSFFLLIGTFFWVTAELLAQHPSFWTAAFGWSLILSNLFALPLMSLSGLYLEQSAREDYTGIFSFIALSYILTPFQAYAAVKGLLEKDESGWIRTLKTGSITDRILQVRMRRLFSWILPSGEPSKRERQETERRRRYGPSALALIFLILMSSLIVFVAATALSVPNNGAQNTTLTLEYLATPVDVNGHPTNRILTHPNHTVLGPGRTDSYTVSGEKWQKAWGFYLHGLLEEDYNMKGSLDLYLYLYSDADRTVNIMIKIADFDPCGEMDHKFFYQVKDVGLGSTSPEDPVLLPVEVQKSIEFRAGHSIVAEVWVIGEGCERYFLDYDSASKHSKIDFPGIVMPESLLPFMLIAPFIPLIVLRARKRRELENGGI